MRVRIRSREHMPIVFLGERDTYLCNIYRKYFFSLGHEVFSFVDGRRLYEDIMIHRPSAVLFSFGIGGGKEYDILRDIQSIETGRRPPVFVLSDFADMRDVQKCRSFSCAGCFVKGHAKPEGLVAKIDEFMRRMPESSLVKVL